MLLYFYFFACPLYSCLIDIISYSFEWLLAYRCIKGEPAIEEYYEMYSEAEKYSNEISIAVMQSSTAQQFLTPGRVVVVKSQSVSNHHMLIYLSLLYTILSLSTTLNHIIETFDSVLREREGVIHKKGKLKPMPLTWHSPLSFVMLKL